MAFIKRSIWQLRDRPNSRDRVLGLSGEVFCDRDHTERLYVLAPAVNWFVPLQPESRTSAEIGAAPTQRDIALREVVTFYLDTSPTSFYRVSSDGGSFSLLAGGSGSSTFVNLTDAASADIPNVNTPVKSALAGKADATTTTAALASKADANSTTNALAAKAALNVAQQSQQTAGATTMLMSSDKASIKDPAGSVDQPLRPTQVYSDTTSGGSRLLTANDLLGGAESQCSGTGFTYQVPKDAGGTGGLPGNSFYIAGTAAPTLSTGDPYSTVNDRRVVDATRSYFTCLLKWTGSNTYDAIGVKSS